MNRIRQTGVIFLVLLMLAGTAGFNVWHHICACQPVEVVKVHSCCDKAEPVAPKADDGCGTGCSSDHKGCRDIPVYFKASIIAIPQVHKVTLPELAAAPVFVIPYLIETPGETASSSITVSHDKPPPRAGKTLVFFLNQLRIPFSV